ncbi:MAG: thioredoxin domain-containing protein [Alphaproteobacteria bacterium]|nr:thioredoxin domain-containing protein [Alphaproteobacteria bacterium]NCQ67061.1 thioredoxin domain-containing protein [Alphaproteobacteria bacterium]NCT07658.1 thioredoxin domain-containing protein [Alphaproteobacteria bacterium]
MMTKFKYAFLFIFLLNITSCPAFAMESTLPSEGSENKENAAQAAEEDNIVYPELNDIVIGSDKAPIILVEYSSINCTHCARFRHKSIKDLKERYITPGKVRTVYKHFPLDYSAVEYMSIVAQQPQEKWPELLEKAYERQNDWLGHPVEKLGEILGISAEDCKKALACDETKGLIMAKRFNAEKVVDIQATPTFHIFYTEKGVKKSLLINEGITPEDLFKKLDELLEKADRV